MKVQRAVAASVFGAMGKGVLAAAAVAAVAVAASWLSWMDISVVLRVVPYEAELVWVDGGVDHDATTQQRLTVLSGDRKPYDVVLVHQAPRPGSSRCQCPCTHVRMDVCVHLFSRIFLRVFGGGVTICVGQQRNTLQRSYGTSIPPLRSVHARMFGRLVSLHPGRAWSLSAGATICDM